ncbi:hypothetical protein BHAOGJBA_4266 [Methylobacterium hispanicum]|uniref:Uncharacterized protein n=1 Tax=Methylobacterium hispanicum TaxID=270350 RepID=A0AAV4ZQD5_9HYPH|nr:hypothetical protein [Methylobacterium hispanicum]GJD90724.1 hypothetical protein BHAOGJBA_4266 [Methylobacterium hispanicum]
MRPLPEGTAFALSEVERENLRFLSRALTLRVDPAVVGFVCRRGGPRPGEDWFEASRVLTTTRRAYDVLPKLIRVVGPEAAPGLILYRWRFLSAPPAHDVLEGRRSVLPGSASILAEAAALAYALAQRALADRETRMPAFEAFARTVERDLPFRAGALALHMAGALIDLDAGVRRVAGWASMEDKLRADLLGLGAVRAARSTRSRFSPRSVILHAQE